MVSHRLFLQQNRVGISRNGLAIKMERLGIHVSD